MKKKKTLKKSEQTKRKKFIALIVALVIIMRGIADFSADGKRRAGWNAVCASGNDKRATD